MLLGAFALLKNLLNSNSSKIEPVAREILDQSGLAFDYTYTHDHTLAILIFILKNQGGVCPVQLMNATRKQLGNKFHPFDFKYALNQLRLHALIFFEKDGNMCQLVINSKITKFIPNYSLIHPN